MGTFQHRFVLASVHPGTLAWPSRQSCTCPITCPRRPLQFGLLAAPRGTRFKPILKRGTKSRRAQRLRRGPPSSGSTVSQSRFPPAPRRAGLPLTPLTKSVGPWVSLHRLTGTAVVRARGRANAALERPAHTHSPVPPRRHGRGRWAEARPAGPPNRLVARRPPGVGRAPPQPAGATSTSGPPSAKQGQPPGGKG